MTGPDGVAVEPVTEFFRDLLAAGRSRRQSGRMGWTCCDGSGSPGRPGSRGTVPISVMPVISAGGCGCPGGERKVTRPGPRSQRDGPAGLLRLSPGGWDRADDQSVPAGPGPAARPFRRSSQPDGELPASGLAVTGRGCPHGSRGRSATKISTRFSRSCRRTGTGHWSRSMCPPGPGHRSCCRPRRRGGSGTAADHRGPQGNAGVGAPSGVAGCVRLAAALSGGDGNADPGRARQPLWWTLRRPVRPLSYHAAHRMFERVTSRPDRP